MRSSVISLGLLLCVLAHTPALARDASDEPEIRRLYSGFRDSWNAPGMPGLEGLFTRDADFVVISGQWLKGRDEIVTYHRKLLSQGYAKSELFVDEVTVRFVDDTTAVVHMTSGARFGNAEIQTSLSTSTVIKTDGRWLITAFHNTLTGGPGFAFGGPPPKK